MRKIKNWGFYALFILGAILDIGFNEIEPVLIEIGLSSRQIVFARILIISAGALRLKLSLPTQNIQKLEEIVEDKNLCNDKTE